MVCCRHSSAGGGCGRRCCCLSCCDVAQLRVIDIGERLHRQLSWQWFLLQQAAGSTCRSRNTCRHAGKRRRTGRGISTTKQLDGSAEIDVVATFTLFPMRLGCAYRQHLHSVMQPWTCRPGKLQARHSPMCSTRAASSMQRHNFIAVHTVGGTAAVTLSMSGEPGLRDPLAE